MPKFITDTTTHTASGEWSFEDHGPDANVNVCIFPNGSTLPVVTYSDGEIFFVPASGALAISKGGVWTITFGS